MISSIRFTVVTPAPSARDLDAVALDHRVGQELAAHLVERGAGAGFVGLGEVEVDDFALAHLADAGKAQTRQRMRDRLALRVEHAGLGHDVDARLHWMVCGPRMSPGPPSGRMPSRRATS